ncbi:hypothetical protein HDE_05296 [Halotydeus destructor]|nr:hypothetical protein HDE_05296 [Halotydeus destructor]
MKKAKICVQTFSAVAASYYILTALIDYFQYETVTSISLAEEPSSKYLVVCAPETFHSAEDFSHVKSFLGKYQYCREIEFENNSGITPFEAMLDMKIFALQQMAYMPWHLSRLRFIFSSRPVLHPLARGLLLYVTFEKRRSSLMPAPYDTNCRHYDQYQCIYECTQTYADWTSCLGACSSPGCISAYLFTLSHAAVGKISSSKFMMQQESIVKSITAEAKTSLSFIVLNVLGLLSVFFGLSVLNIVDAIWWLFASEKKWLRKTLRMICFACAFAQSLLITNDHMQYLYLTETHQGNTIPIPKIFFSVCIKAPPHDKPWADVVKPALNFELDSLLVSRFNSPELLVLDKRSMIEYSRQYESSYSVDGAFCFLLETPENRTKQSKWLDRRIISLQLDLQIVLRSAHNLTAMSANSQADDIEERTLYIKSNRQTMLHNAYLKKITLPHPYKTSCQKYGQGHLARFKSRTHCINSCALSRFKEKYPGLHPVDIPIFSGSDTSHVAGKAREFLDSCRAETCRWIDCEKEQFKLYIRQQSNGSPKIVMTVSKPDHDIYQFQDIPSMLLSHTLLMLISTVGFWAGISLLHTLRGTRKILRLIKAKRLSRLLKKYRHILAIGMFGNIYVAVETFLAYETLSQVHSEPASAHWPFTFVSVERANFKCRISGCCTPKKQLK